MADFGLTNTPLIRDLYDTPQEAMAVAVTLGITGYRTYNINSRTVYVPGATFIEYEKATQLKRVQGAVVARGDQTFGSKLVGLQFANSKTEIKGDPFFTLGNFSMTTSSNQSLPTTIINLDQPKKYSAESITNVITNSAALIGIEVNSSMLIDDIVSKIDNNLRVKVNFDKRKLENYVLFSSLKERMRQSIQEISQQFPASIHVVPISIKYPTITECKQNINDNHTTLSINTATMLNPFKIDISKGGLNKLVDETLTPLRNFSKTYTSYNLWFKGVEYPILNAILPATDNEPLRLIIDGLPFDTLITQNQTLNSELYLKPNKKQFSSFFDKLSDLSSFLLNQNAAGGYIANIYIPFEDDNGDVVNQLNAVAFPMYDNFNIDLINTPFDDYLITLNKIGDDFDRFKTNLIARFLTTESLQEFDTDDRKFNVLLQVYGRMFDEVKQYIDGLTYMRSITYDKVDNLPDALVKNFARMIGLKTFEIQDEDTIIKSLFNLDDTVIEGDLTPAELDIEIWRRVLSNAFFLFKNKGTRKSIEFVMELIGVPESIIEINEYIYLADERLNSAHMDELLFGNNLYQIKGSDFYPYDADGFPTTPKNIPFQANGGSLRINDTNLGPYDFGKTYVDAYKKFKDGIYGFDLIRTIDNQKSWVSSTTEQYRVNNQDLRHTYYYEKDSRLVVNSKEIDIFISLDRIFDVYPYRFFSRNNIKIDSNLSPVYKLTSVPSTLTFDQYLSDIVTKYVNVRNRKTIQTYPTLSKIYFDYLTLLGSSETYINFRKSMEFINKFDSYWIKFIEQFLPATSIVNTGKKIDNGVHFQSKYKYRHGKNIDVDWKGTDGSEFQNKALTKSWSGTTSAALSEGVVRNSYHSNYDAFILTGTANLKYTAYHNAVNDYYGVHYSFTDYCEYIADINIWSPTVDYYNYQNGRQGVFVIHNNNLYRLPSNVAQNIITGQEPSKTSGLYQYLDEYTVGKNIIFSDCLNPTTVERDFFIDALGFGFAYKAMDADFDCPPPLPHVCYYDFNGRTITMDVDNELNYTDNLGGKHKVLQPLYYGFSSNSGTVEPFNATYGFTGNWAIPYKPSKIWTIGNTYYINDIVTSGNRNYVISATIVATTPQVPSSAILTTANTGLYQKYEDRKKTDPLMHIQPAYIKSIVTDSASELISINLTKELNLLQIFLGSDIENTYVATDNIINEQLFISDSITVSLDGDDGNGLYAVDQTNLGPVYKINPSESFVNSISDVVLLKPGVDNYIDLRALGKDFKSGSNNFNLIEELPGFFLVNTTSFLTFKFNLYLESDFRGDQDIRVSFVNQNGKVVNEERFTFSGNGTISERTIYFMSQSVFLANERLYLVIQPSTYPCRLVRYNKIIVNFDESNNLVGAYTSHEQELVDGRFRLNFNGGRAINNGYYIDPLISISPISNVLGVETTFYAANDDVLVNPSNKVQSRLRNYNDIIFNGSTSIDYQFNALFGDYFKKNQSYIKNTTNNYVERYAFDRNIGNDKVDMDITFQTRKLSNNVEPTAKNLKGDTIQVTISLEGIQLGNTLVDLDNAEPTKNIVIGTQSPILKTISYDRVLTVNETYTNNIKNLNLYGFNYGVSDYTELNYVTKLNYYELNYSHKTLSEIFSFDSTGVFVLDIDKPVPSENVRLSSMYTNILAKCEYFDRRIINYKINDVIKYTDVTLSKDILYVCVKNINSRHYNNVVGITDSYIIGGDKSIFIEMTKYSTRNYQLGGYRESTPTYATKNNIVDYLDDVVNVRTFTFNEGETNINLSIPNIIKPGDIVKSVSLNPNNNRYFKLIYNKDLLYSNNNGYTQGDYILFNNIFYWCNSSYSAPGPATPGTQFTQFNPFDSVSWRSGYNTANLLTGPINVYYNSSSIDSENALVINEGYHFDAKKYNDQPFTAYGYLKLGATIVLPYSKTYQPIIPKVITDLQGTNPAIKSGWEMYYRYTENSFMPLFEVVQGIVDRPVTYDSSNTYGLDPAKRMGDNTVLFMNKLYSYVGTSIQGFTGTPTTNPSNDPNWEVKDFMLVSKFKFYKEISNVKVYDGTVKSLSDKMLGNMLMFKSNLTPKNGFSVSNFGSTNNVGDTVNNQIITKFDVIDQQLTNGLNMIHDLKDSNKRVVKQFGVTNLRLEQNDLILDYIPTLDTVGNLPVTGEFASLLRISNPCGHSASVVLGFVITNDDNRLSTIKQRTTNNVVLTTPVVTTPYTLRMMFNQSGKATGKISWSGAAIGSIVLSEYNQYDEALLLDPNKDITFVLTYNVTNKQTAFDYSYLDMINLYPDSAKFGTKLVNTDTVSSEASYDSSTRIITRIITIKSTKENHVLRIGLLGIDAINLSENISVSNIVK